jgi:hypothetical protein
MSALMVIVFNMFRQGTSNTKRSRNEILALQHAANAMAYAVSLPYEGVLPCPPVEIGELDVEIAGEMVPLGIEEKIFTRTVEVREVNPPDWKNAYKIVTVAIKWKENKGQDKEIKIGGLVSK